MQRVKGQIETARWWLGARGRGASLRSLVGYRLGARRSLRLAGVDVSAIDPEITYRVVQDVWGQGDYDQPGFVPQPGWRVVDIGGNVGVFALLAASRGARVTSYEPNPEAFAHLVHNTRSWGVDCRQAAVVGSPQESATLYLHPSRDARSSLFPREIGKAATPLTDGVEVPTVTVDHALAEPCDLLKIDCEGGEFDIFANGTEALGNAKRIIGEVHQLVGDPQQALADLDAAGFEASLHGDPDESFAFLTATRR